MRIVPVRNDRSYFVVRAADPSIADRGTAFAATIDDPEPPRPPNVAWAIDGDAARVESAVSSDVATTYVVPLRGGSTVLHAFVGPPIDVQIDASVFAYDSFFLGCAKRAVPLGVAFDASGAAIARDTATASDLYARGDACTTARRAAFGVVVPRGATFVPTRTLAEFAAVRANAWRAGGPTAFGFATYGTIVTRLRDGRTVKFFLEPGSRTTIDAPFAIANAGGEFADVAFVATMPLQTMRRLPASVRIPSTTPHPIRDGSASYEGEAQ